MLLSEHFFISLTQDIVIYCSITFVHVYLEAYSMCMSVYLVGIHLVLEKKYSGDAVSVTGRTDVAWISVYSEFLSEERGRICIVYT